MGLLLERESDPAADGPASTVGVGVLSCLANEVDATMLGQFSPALEGPGVDKLSWGSSRLVEDWIELGL